MYETERYGTEQNVLFRFFLVLFRFISDHPGTLQFIPVFSSASIVWTIETSLSGLYKGNLNRYLIRLIRTVH